MAPGIPQTRAHLTLGIAGEDLAANFLRGKGYEIAERNWRAGHLELDIICLYGDLIVFVEVKTRSRAGMGGPAGAVGAAKRKRICQAAQLWLAARNCWERPCRFDVICLVGRRDDFRLEHYVNAFEFSPALDCGHPHWQSW